MSSYLKIIIIGNGFDLSHGYKTDYHSFVQALFQENINDNTKHNDLFRFEEVDRTGFSSNQIKIKSLLSYTLSICFIFL